MLPLSTTRSGDIVNPDSINWPVAVVPLITITGVRPVASLYGIKHLLNSPAVSKVTELADCRTSAIFNYGDQVRCCMSINHSHSFSRK